MKNKYEIRGDITAIFINYKGSIIETIISTEDLEKLQKYDRTWYAIQYKRAKTLYVQGHITINGKDTLVKLHRFLLNPSSKMPIDHINRDTLNNTRQNLREVTHSENMQNQIGAKSHSKSGVRGVYWVTSRKIWVAKVILNKKPVFYKQFKDIRLAEQAVIEARLKYHVAI